MSEKFAWRKSREAFVAVSDNVRTVPDQIAPWVPGGLFTAWHGRFWPQRRARAAAAVFEVDIESTVIGTLYALAEKNLIGRRSGGAGDQEDLGVDPEKIQPQIV